MNWALFCGLVEGRVLVVNAFEPFVEPAEEDALPKKGVLGLLNPVTFVGEDYHFGGYVVETSGVESHLSL